MLNAIIIDDLISRMEVARIGCYEIDKEIERMFGFAQVTRSIDVALMLLPKTTTNHHLFSYGGDRDDVEGDCWGFQCHDRAQLTGEERAKRKVKRFYASLQIDKLPYIILEKAIAEQFCDFASSHAATPALAVCITALKVHIGRTVDDELWPHLKEIQR